MKRLFFLLPLLLPAYVLRFAIGPIPTTVLEFLILVITVAWLATRQMEGLRDAWQRAKPWRIPAGLWLVAGIIAVIVSPVHLQALGLFRAYFIEPLLIFFIGLDLIRTEDDRAQMWQSFCIAAIGLAVWAVVQMLTGWGIPHPWDAWPGRRATGPFPFPNALALFVTPIAALAGAKVIERMTTLQKGRILQEIATFVAGLVAILCAQSDGGLVALGAAIFIALLLHRRTRIVAVGIAMTTIILVIVIAPIRSRVTPVIFLKDWSGMVRTVIWKETVTMLTDTSVAGIARPLLGAGLAAYPVAILPFHSATWMEVFQYPHDIFLNLWSETGVLGLIAFGWIIATWLQKSKRPGRMITLSVVMAVLVHGLVDVPYFKNDLAVAFWLLILLTTHENRQPSVAS